MHKYIENLKSKSENTRKQVFTLSLIICMTLVVLIWVGSISHKVNVQKKIAEANGGPKPFALFGEVVKNTYKNITASAGDISTTIKDQKSKLQKEKDEMIENEKVIDLIPVEYTE